MTGGSQLRIDDSIVRKSESLNLRELDDEGVLYDASTKAMHVLNRTALLVWQLCDTKEDAEGVAGEIAGRYAAMARDVALRQGWTVRAQWIETEFPSTVRGPRPTTN